MRWILRLFGRILVANLALLLVISGMRLLPLPTEMQALGLGQCEGKPCFQRAVNVVDFNQRPITISWIVAWLGSPCTAQSTAGGNVILRFPNAEVYATSRGYGGNIFLASARLWAVALSQPTLNDCPESKSKWTGFSTIESITAGAFVSRQ
ncbi:MAG: hypothetical protein KF726_27520 [Anaerolineae bacterium]|nr:hypothetical protein [Anaerolineae bacterium]